MVTYDMKNRIIIPYPLVGVQKSGILHPFSSFPLQHGIEKGPHSTGQLLGHGVPLLPRGPGKDY